MKRLSVEQVIELHKKMLNTTGGADGIRELSLLESALNNAFATFDGIELYKTTEEKCANICYCVVKNHPFIDGNKRMGIYLMLILLEYNGQKVTYTQDELVSLGIGIANGSYLQEFIQQWIMRHEV